MKRLLSVVAVMLLFSHSVAGRVAEQLPDVMLSPTKSFAQSLSESYDAFYKGGGVFEKLYLMTDKPYYSAGETLFLSGYLVHATLLTRNSSSRYVYVELITPEGQLVERIKIDADRGQFVGTFSLNARLTSGRYTLRAYTRWMTNFDMGYLFTREIYIGNYIDDAILTSVKYSVEQSGLVTARIRISDQFALPIVSTPVRYRTIIDGKSRSGQSRSDKNGEITLSFRPSENPNDCIEIKVHANSRDLHRYIQMPSFSNDFHVHFCPEGGNLIGGVAQVIAFKALSVNGRSCEVTGDVFNSKGERVANIATEHRGMGRFVMRPEVGESYYAEFTKADGITKRIDLPQVESAGVALRVMRQSDSYTVLVQPSGVDISNYAAVIHSRGAVVGVVESLQQPIKLHNRELFDGIAQISIVEKGSNTVVAERLFYVRNGRYAAVNISSNKSMFNCRDKVVMNLYVTDSQGRAATGNFSMTVTDASVVEREDKEQNILSYMLLSSDLRGEVEDPGSYFIDSSPKRLDNLDLVMMTNGWRRYELQSVLSGQLPRILYPMEDSERVRGSVFGLIGRAKKPSVVLMNPKTMYVEQFELNEYNNFIISGLDCKEDTQYIIQALNKKGKDKTVRIELDTENYPIITSSHIREYYLEPAMPVPSAFLTRAKERYFFEGGERVVDIEEIVVMARRSTSFFATSTAGSMLHGDLSRFATVYDALATFKELDVVGTMVTTKNHYAARDVRVAFEEDNRVNSEGEGDVEFLQTVPSIEQDVNVPEVYINGNVADISALGDYDTKYVERLSFADGRAATMLGLSALQGAILMEVSREGMVYTSDTDAMARVLIRGSHMPAEFFKPKYSTATELYNGAKDMRSTIAWEPLIRPSEGGLVSVDFYTADRSGVYDVIIEGITDSGELLYSHTQLEVRK